MRAREFWVARIMEIITWTGFKIVLSCAQHWKDLSGWREAIERLRLNVSQQVCAFISSRDRDWFRVGGEATHSTYNM
jgi:hypothetical protein